MKIKKISQSVPITSNVTNTKNKSDTDTYSCNYLNNMFYYPEDGKSVRIGTWGKKPLYRSRVSSKVVLPGQGGGTLTIPHNISNIEMIVVEKAFFFQESGNGRSCELPTGYGYNGTWNEENQAYVEIDKTNVIIRSSGGWGENWKKIVIFNYTLTTDEGEE